MTGRFVLVQTAEGKLIAIPASSLVAGEPPPPRASSAPPTPAERPTDILPTRPASVETQLRPGEEKRVIMTGEGRGGAEEEGEGAQRPQEAGAGGRG